LERFLEAGLPRYAEERNALVDEPTSRLSPYLHFGHLSTHEVVHALFAHAGWTPDRLSPTAKGQRQGWWNLDPNAEAFLDQIITWRELGFNMCQHRADYASFDSLPEWARRTLAEHEADPRPHQYDPETMDAAGTHDEIWNAAQRQLRREGRIHNYLRMLWGKKILEWSPSPRQALDTMIELNNRYALDGRDPNSYSGIFWTLGRYDRPWGPERPIFGTIRYMSSENTARKLSLKPYLAAFGPESQPELWDSGGDG
jgi:deoxyribodipyrimidine photo-lyase